MPVPDSDPRTSFKGCPEWKAQQKILWAEVWKETGRKSRWKIRDLLVDTRCSQVVLDFLSATDVGRRVPAEGDTESEASGWEVRERRDREEERREEKEGYQLAYSLVTLFLVYRWALVLPQTA